MGSARAGRRRAAGWLGLCGAAAAAFPAAAEPPPFGSSPSTSPFGGAPPPALFSPDAADPGFDPDRPEAPAAAPEGGVPLTQPRAAEAAPVRVFSPYTQLGDFGVVGIPYGGLSPSAADPNRRDWSVVPSLGVQVLGTDNALQRTGQGRSDFITAISPSVAASADTLRLRGGLVYAPIAQIYARDSGQDRVDQRFVGQAVAALVPERLFLDARGFSTVQATSGGFAPQTGPVAVDRRNTVQTTTFQVSPYLVQRFGSAATAQLGYAFSYGSQDGNTATAAGTNLPFFRSQEYTAHEGFAVLRTGEDFGRLALQARLDGTTFDGTGVLDNAHRNFATVEARYALLPGLAALVEGGYEDQKYAGAPGLRIQDAVWTVGVFLNPTPNSVVSAGYRHIDGFNAPFLNARVALGGRTVLFGSYIDRLSTPLRRTQSLLATTTLDAQGNPVDAATGAPLLLADSFLAVQGSLLRIKSLTAGVSQVWRRDTLSFTLLHEERVPAALAPGLFAFSQRGTTGSVVWQHDLSPNTVLAGYAQYGAYTSGIGSGDVFTIGASLAHSFNENLVGLVQFFRTDRGESQRSAQLGNSGLSNVILAGLRMRFNGWGR